MDITPVLHKELERSKISSGILNVYVKHTTTGLWINESGEGIPSDLEATLKDSHLDILPTVMTTRSNDHPVSPMTNH